MKIETRLTCLFHRNFSVHDSAPCRCCSSLIKSPRIESVGRGNTLEFIAYTSQLFFLFVVGNLDFYRRDKCSGTLLGFQYIFNFQFPIGFADGVEIDLKIYGQRSNGGQLVSYIQFASAMP